jgi:RimJ/RimL family protein N-acetyltransferase
MYAWEAGFNKKETRKWLNHQLARYRNDGYGYFAVSFKRGGKLIGQVGLMKTEINGDEITEIGYIFNNKYWGMGYAIEAARACVDLAFNQFGLERVYATIRPENTASVKVTERLGMMKTGQYIKVYQDKEMPHDIYMLEKSSSTSGLT